MSEPEFTIEAAIARLQQCVGAGARDAVVESVSTHAAHGRVLARDVIARVDLPAFDNAAMDGYALDGDGVVDAATYAVIGTALAGRPFDGTLAHGECVRIMTGAPLPHGADTVIMREDTLSDAPGGAPCAVTGRMTVQRAVPRGANVRRCGEQVARGEPVLRTGQLLAGPHLGLALGAGSANIVVFRSLQVGVLSTGDELADPPAPLPLAGSYDANRAFLIDACRQLGFVAVDLGICRDEPAAFSRCIDAAHHARLDVVLATGGAAQGDADIVRRAGGVQFVPIALRPGRGIAHACWPRERHRLDLLGLPGNAVAAFVMFHLVARPVLLALAGASAWRPLRISVALAQAAQARGGRVDYRRARLHAPFALAGQPPGPLVAELLPQQGSGMLRTIVDADALVAIGPQPDYAAGDLVEAIPLHGALA